LKTRVFLTPRNAIEQAPLTWFDLQRKWWRGTQTPDVKTVAAPAQSEPRFARNLTQDWKFQLLRTGSDASRLVSASVDDKSWTSRNLGMWNTKETGGNGHGIFRRTFTIPANWSNGRVSLWMTSWWNTAFVERGRVWLDGQEVKGLNGDPYLALALPSLAARTTHTLAVEIQSEEVLAGLRGQCWISFEPTASQTINLAGLWQPSPDGLRYDAPIALPGAYNTQFLRRKVVIDNKHRGQNVMLTVEGDSALVSVLINGTLMRRHHHMLGNRWSLNLAPFVRWGEDNEIEVVRWESAGAGNVREVSLNFFDPKLYP
jgi:hypothetical protein